VLVETTAWQSLRVFYWGTVYFVCLQAELTQIKVMQRRLVTVNVQKDANSSSVYTD